MANIVFNMLTITGNQKEVEKVFNNKCFSWRCANPKNEYKSFNNLEEFLSVMQLYLRSWLPMPKTFENWDTSNKPCPQFYNWRTGKPFNSDEEYKAYLNGYRRAVRYQQKKYGVVGWYAYNVKTLGRKANCELDFVSIENLEDGNISVKFNIESPWRTPIIWFWKMASNFSKELTWEMESHEESGLFNNLAVYRNGKFRVESIDPIPNFYEQN